MRIAFSGFVAVSLGAGILGASAQAAEPNVDAMVERAVKYLSSQGQAEDGSFSAQASPAITALVTTGVLRHGRSVNDPLVAKSLKYLEGLVQPDGSIGMPDSTNKNYETSIAVLCFKEANKDGRYDAVLKNADKFLRGLQWDESEGVKKENENFGGAGYGRHKRPDLSNTTFLLDALEAGGADANDEAVQKALIFVSRCQNLESKYNTTKFAPLVADGGFYYTIAAGGSSQAGKTDEGGLRSYASMTYAGLKSMIFAGVGPDDERVKAAVEWARRHYTLDENPGMMQSGLYYYYHTFAKALAAMGRDQIEDAQGEKHDWRKELIAALAERQNENGSWANPDPRWMEGDPNLTTGYALLALAHAKGK